LARFEHRERERERERERARYMGLQHCQPGEVLNLLTLRDNLPQYETFAAARTASLEVVRRFLAKGRKVPLHHAPGEITVQCLQGRVSFFVNNEPRELIPGDWLFLLPKQAHSLEAHEDSVVLISMWRRPKE
jgi:quercetin dioxygenase-like cupin family protein